MAVGYLIALPPSEWIIHIIRFIIGAITWAVMLNGGTLAFNSAFDRDTGDIGYLDSPPPVPNRLWFFSLLLMISGGIIAFFISYRFAVVYWLCFFLSVAYSCPPIRLKTKAGFDIAINMIGYGALTTYAGWACISNSMPSLIIFICLGYAFLFGSLYPLTQIYQYHQDLSRGDKTFSMVLGFARSIRFSFITMLCSFTIFAIVSFLENAKFYIFIVPLSLWLIILIPWMIRGDNYPQKRGMYRALWAWAVTDVTVVTVFSVL